MIWSPLRGGRRIAALFIAATILAILGAAPASAHSSLERSEPQHGGKIAIGGTNLTLWFSEPISAQASVFELRSQDGAPQLITAAVTEAGGRGVVEIGTEPLERGIYELDWAVLSLEDGHIDRGRMVFGAGEIPDVVLDVDTSLPESPVVLLRWLDLAALMLVIGALAVSGRVVGSLTAARNAVRDQVWNIGFVAAVVAIAAGAMTPFFRVPRGDSSLGAWLDVTWSTLIDTPWGQLWLAREIGLVIVAVALWKRSTSRDGSKRTVQVALVALVAVVGLESWAGHASALPRQPELAAFASATHTLAAGVWAGGLGVLAFSLIPAMRRNPDVRGPMLSSVWRAFSPMAAIASVVLLATGLYESGRHVPGLDAISSTVYGAGVGTKIVLAAGALTLAGFNTLLINPRLTAPVAKMLGRPVGWAPVSLRRFTRVVVAEALVLLVAVGVAALLTSVASAREIEAAAQETTPQSATVEGMFVTFEVVPAGADQSRVIVGARALIRPQPAPISGVAVDLAPAVTAPTSVALNLIEPGRYEVETAKLGPGAWQVSVAVQRDPASDVVAQFGWTVGVDTSEDTRPFELATTVLAVLLLAGLAGAIQFSRRRRQDPADPMPLVYERSEIQR